MVDLNALTAAIAILCLLASAKPCPPYWQCNGKPEQNHPACARCYA